jgi:hypothetical protein
LVRLHLQQVAPRLSTGDWTLADRILPGGRETWVLRTGSVEAAGVEPFRRVSEIAPDGQQMARLLIVLTTAPVEGHDEFLVIATRTIPNLGPSAEDVVRPRCAGPA